jgi:hypothetical protein
MSQVKTVKIKDGDDFRVINESDFKYGQHELYEGEKLSTDSVVVNLEVGITPELQATIDEAKAECEKVVAENIDLKEQLNKEREAVKKLDLENAQLKGQVLTAEKTLLAADAEIKALKAPPKKPTAAELKAAKAAEEADTAEQPKE